MQTLVTVLVSITLAEMMFAMGLRLSFSRLTASLGSSPGLVIRAFFANYLVIPGITLLFIAIFQTDPMVAVGLIILGVSPAAPYGPPFTIIARGNLALSTGLMIILAGFSVILAPFLLHTLLPLIPSTNFDLTIDPRKLILTLLVIQFMPLCLGLALGQWMPVLAARLLKPATQISKLLNFFMIIAIATLQFKIILAIGADMVIRMFLLVVTGILAGWIAGWPGRENRITLSIVTGMRNMSLSLGIATVSFPGSPVVTTVIAYSFIAGSALLIYSYAIRWIFKSYVKNE
jgi:BASS family bile acid:Na+ symporter